MYHNVFILQISGVFEYPNYLPSVPISLHNWRSAYIESNKYFINTMYSLHDFIDSFYWRKTNIEGHKIGNVGDDLKRSGES